MNARRILTAMALSAIMAVAVRTSIAGMLTVTSTNNGLGQFEYVISGGPDLFFFGGGSTSLSIIIPSFGILSATASPGWLVATNGTSVTLVHPGSLVLDNIIAVTATIASASAVAILYDDLAIDGAYPRGWIIGDVYTTNLTLYVSAASNETVSLNVAGYERFALVGPLVPEPVAPVFGVLGAVAACRRRSLVIQRAA